VGAAQHIVDVLVLLIFNSDDFAPRPKNDPFPLDDRLVLAAGLVLVPIVVD